MIERSAIIDEARSWLATPFHHQGYLKRVGADCIGFICGVALALGIQGAEEWKADPQYHQYGRPPNPKFLLKCCDHFLARLRVEDVQSADILVMSFAAEPMHFALVASLVPAYIIHSSMGAGRVIEHRLDTFWRNRVRLAYSFRGVS